jgi:hypothetical protein
MLVSLVNVWGMNDCSKWKTGKHHKYTDIGKLETTQIVMAAVPYITSGSGLKFTQFQAI